MTDLILMIVGAIALGILGPLSIAVLAQYAK